MTTSNTAAPDHATDLRDHGIAVRKGVCFNFQPWRDAKTGRDYVYAAINGNPSLIVQLDVATGRCRSFRMPAPCGAPWGLALTLEGHLLATSVCGRLCRLDPETGRFWVTANTGQWSWSVSRGADGRFYISTSSETRLFRYDAGTERVEDLGRLDPKEKYARPVIGGSDGYLYVGVGSAESQVVAYHIGSGKVTRLLPKTEVGSGWQLVGRGRDGQIYAHTIRGNIYRLAHGEAFFDAESTRQCRTQPSEVFWGRLTLPALPDGRTVALVDLDQIRIGEGRRARLWPLRYETDGTNIFHLAGGPAQTVYASTIYPQHILRYTPATKKLEDLGRGGPDRAEGYSIGHCDGKVYYGTYSGAKLMCYDPARPLHRDPPGQQKWRTNPKLLGYLGKGNCRPRAMCIDSRKRVWVGGFPEYGYRHGGLACYDIPGKKLSIYDEAVSDQSIDALAADPSGDLLYGGTNHARGGGLEPLPGDAQLIAWDTRRKQRRWKVTPIPGMKSVSNLLYRDGKLYGTTGFKFFRFDVQRRAVDYVIESEISGPREHSICFGPDGNIYGITWMVLFRWRPETGKIEELYRCLGDDAKGYAGGSLFHRGAVVIEGRFYFSCGPSVKSLRLPAVQLDHREQELRRAGQL